MMACAASFCFGTMCLGVSGAGVCAYHLLRISLLTLLLAITSLITLSVLVFTNEKIKETETAKTNTYGKFFPRPFWKKNYFDKLN